jgi:O-antigen ligase
MPTLTWMVLVLPGFLLTVYCSSKQRLAGLWILVAYIYSMLVFTSVSTLGFSTPDATLPMDETNYLRAATHFVVFFVLLYYFLVRSKPTSLSREAVLAYAALSGMLLSVIVNLSSPANILRIVINSCMVTSLFVFLPTLIKPESYFPTLSKIASWTAISFGCISAYAIYFFGPYPEWSTRLGRPLNSGVLSYVFAIALIGSILMKGNLITRAVLVLGLILTGSRLDLLITLAYVFYVILRKKREHLGIVVIVAACFIGTVSFFDLYLDDPAVEQLFHRGEDQTSGRLEMWDQSLEGVLQAPWIGQGGRFFFEEKLTTLDKEFVRTHNMFLENALSYGIPASLLSVAVVLSMIPRLFRTRSLILGASDQLGLDYARGVYLLVFGHLLFDTSSWNNLGDAPTMLSFSIILPAIGRIRMPQLHESWKNTPDETAKVDQANSTIAHPKTN